MTVGGSTLTDPVAVEACVNKVIEGIAEKDALAGIAAKQAKYVYDAKVAKEAFDAKMALEVAAAQA